ncbi:hypothetical protein [Rhizomonospora bruguierae]|uniref:hypothetical protein n=1 Tax=Rhizomonospora bruguierae TaxID=1581705 RepID=UPI001BCA9E99|nr:hypothetical protein [Micromonospora sp. NBRC 107566]
MADEKAAQAEIYAWGGADSGPEGVIRVARTLRVVTADEPAAPMKPKTVTEAADAGTTRELLVAMRARIAKAVEDRNTPPRDLAALTKRLVEVVRDIEAIDAREQQEVERDGPVSDEAFDAKAI